MSQQHKESSWWERNPDTIFRLVVAVCVLLVVVEGVAHFVFHVHKHGHFKWESFPAFHGLYGFAIFVVVVYLGRALRPLVKRREDYYGR